MSDMPEFRPGWLSVRSVAQAGIVLVAAALRLVPHPPHGGWRRGNLATGAQLPACSLPDGSMFPLQDQLHHQPFLAVAAQQVLAVNDLIAIGRQSGHGPGSSR